MRKQMIIVLILIAAFLLTATACGKTAADGTGDAEAANAEQNDSDAAAEPLTVAIKEISKHGNLILDVTFEKMAAAGIEVGDIITVIAGDAEYDLPVGNSYTDVDNGQMICRFDREDNEVGIAINMGDFASETSIAEKQTIEEDPGYRWEIKIPEIQIKVKEKQGYLEQYNARNLMRTDVRSDYPDLTDEDFANFRAVSVTGLKKDTLYRSSSPLDPGIGRSEYAMAAMEQAGIKAVVNLTDSVEAMEGYETYPDSYYSGCAVANPEMGYDFTSEAFAEQMKTAALFLAENDGPYLIHCKEGKDRTGVLCAVIECFAGASAEEVKEDYMRTYVNFYGIAPADSAYDIILNDNLVKTLCGLFGVDSIETAELKEEATQYLISIGLTEEQLGLLGEKLLEA